MRGDVSLAAGRYGRHHPAVKPKVSVVAPKLKLADALGRSLVIHGAGDNYTDNPENGGGKGRIACGVIPKS